MDAARITGAETAMALVRAAADGLITRDQLVELLSDRTFAPHEYTFPISRRANVDNSLVAVDVAFFQKRLITADQYDHILDTAVVRPVESRG